MALRLTRLVVNCALVARKQLFRQHSSFYHFKEFKVRARASITSSAQNLSSHFVKFQKTQPLLIAFLGISFGKKEEDNKPLITMTEAKAQLEKADQLFEENKFQETSDLLKGLEQSDAEVLWRQGRALFKLASEETNSTKKADLIREAYKFAAESLAKDESIGAVHKWYAILLDAKSNLEGIKERVTQLENVKKHMERAIKLNPNDPTSRYILGEFQYGLADLPWYQRKVVSTIFATPPTGTYDEALASFLKAEELSDDFYSMNKLMIAKCYQALKNNDKAKEYLVKAVKQGGIQGGDSDDRKCLDEAESLLKKVK